MEKFAEPFKLVEDLFRIFYLFHFISFYLVFKFSFHSKILIFFKKKFKLEKNFEQNKFNVTEIQDVFEQTFVSDELIDQVIVSKFKIKKKLKTNFYILDSFIEFNSN